MRTWTILLGSLASILLVPALRRKTVGRMMRQPWMRNTTVRTFMALPWSRRMLMRKVVRPVMRRAR